MEVSNQITIEDDEDHHQQHHHLNIPIEEQVEDLPQSNVPLDPLEWAVRKTISIPKKYYWETGNYNVSTKVKIWHRTVQALGKGLHATEAVGGFFVHILGLDSSRLSYVTDFMTEEEWEQAYRTKEEDQGKRDLVQEIQKNQEMHRV